jgi:hypothetical protein
MTAGLVLLTVSKSKVIEWMSSFEGKGKKKVNLISE